MDFLVDDLTLYSKYSMPPRLGADLTMNPSLRNWVIALNLPLTEKTVQLALALSAQCAQVIVTSPEEYTASKEAAAFLVSKKIPTYVLATNDWRSKILQYQKTLAYTPDIIIDTNYSLVGYGYGSDPKFLESFLSMIIETSLNGVPAYIAKDKIFSTMNGAQYLADNLEQSEVELIFKAIDYYCYWYKEMDEAENYMWDENEHEWY